MLAIAVNEQIPDAEMADGLHRAIDGLAHDDDGAIGVVHQIQRGGFVRCAAESLGIVVENDRLADFDFAGGQEDFAAIGQKVQGVLNFGGGDASVHGECPERGYGSQRGGRCHSRGRDKKSQLKSKMQ